VYPGAAPRHSVPGLITQPPRRAGTNGMKRIIATVAEIQGTLIVTLPVKTKLGKKRIEEPLYLTVTKKEQKALYPGAEIEIELYYVRQSLKVLGLSRGWSIRYVGYVFQHHDLHTDTPGYDD